MLTDFLIAESGDDGPQKLVAEQHMLVARNYNTSNYNEETEMYATPLTEHVHHPISKPIK